MKACAACGRDGDLKPRRSVLDKLQYECCVVCIEHKAEPVVAVVRTVNSSGWKALPLRTRRAVRVFDLEEYVRIPVWAKRMSHRQLAMIRQKEEDEDILATVKERLAKPAPSLSTDHDQAGASSKRLNLFSWIG